MKKSLLVFVSSALLIATAAVAQPVVVQSPNQQISVTFDTRSSKDLTQSGGQLVYAIAFNGRQLIDPSIMSLDMNGTQPLGADLHIVRSEKSAKDDNYRLVVGKASEVRDHYNAVHIYTQENAAPMRKLEIEARVYNDAVAFRYLVPEQGLGAIALKNENTEFHFSKDATTYSLVLPHYQSMYESEFLKLPVSAFSNQGGVNSHVLIGLPMLAEVPGVGWAAIAEADLKGYTSMYLTNPSGGWNGHSMLSRLSPKLDSSGIAVSSSGSLQSAWRIIMIGSTAGKIVKSNAVMNMSQPTALSDVSWIKPGKASWDWWSGSIGADGKPAFTTENMKYYVDFAAKSGFTYMLVDAGWSGSDLTKMNGKVDIPALVDYAKTKGIKIWIWAYAKYVANQMEAAFAQFEKWGVAGVKIDFIERDDQEGIQFYYDVASAAANHHLMLDLHGSTKPFGLERTYPNVMNYEAVLGMEQSKGGMRDNPDNHTMLPFTRMLVGPMDYTPGGFDNVTREAFESRSEKPMVMGTRAHHLALYVVLQAPFEMVSDYPDAYTNQPGFDFIKKVPTSWDETKVVAGTPGEFITIARRSGTDWYVGSITNWQDRQVSIPLKFLEEGTYKAEIYSDAPDAGKNPKHLLTTTQTVTKNTVLHPTLVTGGGYCVRITKNR